MNEDEIVEDETKEDEDEEERGEEVELFNRYLTMRQLMPLPCLLRGQEKIM